MTVILDPSIVALSNNLEGLDLREVVAESPSDLNVFATDVNEAQFDLDEFFRLHKEADDEDSSVSSSSEADSDKAEVSSPLLYDSDEEDAKISRVLFVPRPLRSTEIKRSPDVRFLTLKEAREIIIQLGRSVNRPNEHVYTSPLKADSPGICRIGVWSYADIFQFTEMNVRRLFQTLPPIHPSLRRLFEYNCSKIMDSADALKTKYNEKVDSFHDLAKGMGVSLVSTMELLKKEKLTDEDVERIQNNQCDCLAIDLCELQEMVQEDLDHVNAILLSNGRIIRNIRNCPPGVDFFFFRTLDRLYHMKVMLADPNFAVDLRTIHHFYQMHQTILREHSVYLSKFITAIITVKSAGDRLNAAYDSLLESINI